MLLWAYIITLTEDSIKLREQRLYGIRDIPLKLFAE
jgi:hypothetical protein